MRLKLLMLTLCAGAALAAEPSPELGFLRFDAERVPVGTVYHYQKSNIDGSHAGRVSIYVAASDRLESYKWSEGNTRATHVAATIDWKLFSVGRFESSHRFADGRFETYVTMEREPGSRRFTARSGEMELSVDVERWPWHSYDFDFASLHAIWRHLVEPEKPFRFGVTDFVMSDDAPPGLVDKGWVDVVYLGREMRAGEACRAYRLDGAGLENRGGKIWFTVADSVLVDYEIALPDEDEYDSGKLLLLDREPMTPQQWSAFQRARLE